IELRLLVRRIVPAIIPAYSDVSTGLINSDPRQKLARRCRVVVDLQSRTPSDPLVCRVNHVNVGISGSSVGPICINHIKTTVILAAGSVPSKAGFGVDSPVWECGKVCNPPHLITLYNRCRGNEPILIQAVRVYRELNRVRPVDGKPVALLVSGRDLPSRPDSKRHVVVVTAVWKPRQGGPTPDRTQAGYGDTRHV